MKEIYRQFDGEYNLNSGEVEKAENFVSSLEIKNPCKRLIYRD